MPQEFGRDIVREEDPRVGIARGDLAQEGIARAAIDYISELFAGNAGGHDLAHSLRVHRNALDIAAGEPACDIEVVELAALLHDADDHKLFQTVDNANARRFLVGRLPDERIDRICRDINAVSFSKNRGRRPATLEGKIVQDADRLDAIGAIGIARAFAYGGEHGRPLSATVEHFHEKLLLLADEMNTDAGRRLARRRHAYLLGFLAELDAELADTCL